MGYLLTIVYYSYSYSCNIFNKKATFVLKNIVCDAPAKSFVKVTKQFNAKFGCDKCIVMILYTHT